MLVRKSIIPMYVTHHENDELPLFQLSPPAADMPPESLRRFVTPGMQGVKTDGKAHDMFSCGVLLYVMMLGRFPRIMNKVGGYAWEDLTTCSQQQFGNGLIPQENLMTRAG